MVGNLLKEKLQLKKYLGIDEYGCPSHAEPVQIKGRSTVNKGFKVDDGRVYEGFSDVIYTATKVGIFDMIDGKTVKKVLEIKNSRGKTKFYIAYVE